MEYQADQAQAQDQSESNDNRDEKVIICKPETVHNGAKCKHEYVEDYTDAEGKVHEQCTQCWQGKWK